VASNALVRHEELDQVLVVVEQNEFSVAMDHAAELADDAVNDRISGVWVRFERSPLLDVGEERVRSPEVCVPVF